MDSDSWLLYVLFFALILGGGYFASTEIAFASANKIRLKTQAETGDRRAKTAIYISEHFEKALTTLLIGNNIMHIGCSSLATVLATHLWGPSSVGVVTVVVTVIVFFVSEMLPKSYARSHADQVVLAFSGSLRFLMRVLTPFAWVFNQISLFVSRLFGANKAPSYTEAELEYVLENAQDSADIRQEPETRRLSAAVALDHIPARQVMQPAEKMEALPLDIGTAQLAAYIKTHRHSRIPIYRNDPDHIIGILHIRDFLRVYLRQGEKTRLRALLNPPVFVAPEAPIDEVLRQMSSQRNHLAIVQDAGHKTLGLVTVEDILEELVGDIQDEEDDEGTVNAHA